MRRGIARALVAMVTVLGLTGMGIAGAAAAGASIRAAAARAGAHAVGAPAPLAQDLSGTLPNLDYGQAIGDFTGAGHDQIAYYDDGNLHLANAGKFGGGVVRSAPTELRNTPNDGFPGYDWPVWDPDYPALVDNGAAYALPGVKVAASADNIYMAGATWDDNDPLGTYRLHLYKLPHDGSCAQASCAEATADLPATYIYDGGDYHRHNKIVVTSLATGVVGGQTLIAVGLSDDGLYIFNDQLQQVEHLTGFDVPGADPPAQVPLTALAFGPPSGPGQGGLLAVGLESPYHMFASFHLNPDGTYQSGGMTPAAEVPYAVTTGVTFAHVGGQLAEVFTRAPGTSGSPGDVLALNTDASAVIAEIPVDQRYGEPIGVGAVTPWDGTADNQDLAVGMNGETGLEVVRDVGGTLQRVPFAAGGATTGTLEQVYDWWPGYGSGRLQVVNDTGAAVSVQMASRPDAGYGCWLDTAVTDPPVPAFPADPVPLAAGASSPGYFIGALTAGPDGGCAAATGTGEWSAYVVITPAGDPADQHEVKLQADPAAGLAGMVRIAAQAGGDLTAALQPGGPDGSGTWWGGWQLHVTGPGLPAAAAAPAVAGFQLTSPPASDYQAPSSPVADDPCRPVYRFDVTGARWTVPGAAADSRQVTAQIPAMTAQGSTDGGKTWTDLGQLMPSAAPSLAGDIVTLGPSSFYWQDPPGTATAPGVVPAGQTDNCPTTGSAPLTDVRVVSGALASAAVPIASLNAAAPPIGGGPGAQPVSSITATPDDPSGTAMPRADGVDQAPLTLQLVPPAGGGYIPPTDPQYQLIYYRVEGSNALVTGLYAPGNYAGYIAVGRYAADGGTQPVKSYLVTTSTASQAVFAVLNDSGEALTSAPSSAAVKVAALGGLLSPAGTAAAGIQVTGCATGICPLTAPAAAAPALYQAGGPASGPASGIQFQASAVTGVASLPLAISASNAHQIAAAPLDVLPDRAVLRDTSQFWPKDTIDTALVTHGQLVQALSIPVGGS